MSYEENVIGFSARLRTPEERAARDRVALPFTVRSHNLGSIPTSDEVLAVARELGSQISDQSENFACMVGRIRLNWAAESQRGMTFNVEDATVLPSEVKALAKHRGLEYGQALQLVAEATWTQHHECRVREMALREFVKSELQK